MQQMSEDIVLAVPRQIREPAMGWLGKGRDKLEKWFYFQVTLLQRKAVREPESAAMYQGMMLMLKLLLFHTTQGAFEEPPRVMGAEDEEEKPDFQAELRESLGELSSFFGHPKKQRGEQLRKKIIAERKREGDEPSEG